MYSLIYDDDHPGEVYDEDLCDWLPEDRVERFSRLKELHEQYKDWGGEFGRERELCRQKIRELVQDDRAALARWLHSVGGK